MRTLERTELKSESDGFACNFASLIRRTKFFEQFASDFLGNKKMANKTVAVTINLLRMPSFVRFSRTVLLLSTAARIWSRSFI